MSCTFPWQTAPLPPWQTANPLFDRVVDVHRPRSPEVQGGVQEVGYVGYSGTVPTTVPGALGEDILYTGVVCTIIIKGASHGKGPLPADVVWKASWGIHIPSSSGIPLNGIRDRDILIDDDGYRYAVSAAEWHAVGWTLDCMRLEA